MLRTVMAGAALLGASAVASAFPVDFGYFSRETSTGLDWLDVRATAGISYNDVRAGAGGWTNSGWRYASGAEVRHLFEAALGVPSENFYRGDVYPDLLASAFRLVRQLGVTTSFNTAEGIRQLYGTDYPIQVNSLGMFDDGTANARVGIADLSARSAYEVLSVVEPESTTGTRWVAYDDWWGDLDSVQPNAIGIGSYLVRSSSLQVSEPPALAFSTIAVGAMLVIHQRRRTQAT